MSLRRAGRSPPRPCAIEVPVDPFGKFLAAAGAALMGLGPAELPPKDPPSYVRIIGAPPLPRWNPARPPPAAPPALDDRATAAISPPDDGAAAGVAGTPLAFSEELLFAEDAGEALAFRFADSFPDVRDSRAFAAGGPLAGDLRDTVPARDDSGLRAAAARARDAAIAHSLAPPPRARPAVLGRGEVQVARLEPADRPAPPARRSGLSCLTALAALGVDAVSVPPIRQGGCGIPAPIEVSAIGEGRQAVSLEPSATLNCGVAEALAEWLAADVQPAAREHLRGRITGLRIAASYSCRGRNNVRGARLSEHAFGNAVDIAAFEVDGRDWIEVEGQRGRGGAEGRFLAAIRQEACGPFTTVLGPGSDAAHHDHFHLDLARRGRNQDARYCH